MANPVKTATISSTAYNLTHTSAWAFSTTQVAAMKAIRVSSSGADLRFLSNGDTPTATVGHVMQDGQTYQLYRHSQDSPELIQIIAKSGSATVTIEMVNN